MSTRTVKAELSKGHKVYVCTFQVTDTWTIEIILQTVEREMRHLYKIDANWQDPIRLEIEPSKVLAT